MGSSWSRYLEGFRASIVHWIPPGLEVLDQPGVLGYLGTADQRSGRIVITDDRAIDLLEEIGDPFLSIASVHPSATRCRAHLAQLEDYEANAGTAMVTEDLADLPTDGLDPELSLRRAAVLPTEGEIRLSAAAAACFSFEPPTERELPDPDAFALYLNSIPNSTILTATDEHGTIRATAGSAVFGPFARVFFVSTDPTWRGRGVGTAMTATAFARRPRARGRQSMLRSERERSKHLPPTGVHRGRSYHPVRQTLSSHQASAVERPDLPRRVRSEMRVTSPPAGAFSLHTSWPTG